MVAVFLGRATKGLLLGEPVPSHVTASICAIARAQPGVQHSNALFTEHVGPNQIIAAISADFGDTLSATDVERIVATGDGRARETHPEIVAVPHSPAESRQTAISSPL